MAQVSELLIGNCAELFINPVGGGGGFIQGFLASQKKLKPRGHCRIARVHGLQSSK